MKLPIYRNLHLHSTYSITDGAMSIDQIVKKTKEFKQDSVALTEHGNMFSAIKFYESCKDHEIKPIIGMEAYIVNSIKENTPQKNIYHIVLLAKNNIGYKNLIKLSTKSYLNGFYYKPRIDPDLLNEHKEGLIVLTACIKGILNSIPLTDKIQGIFKDTKDFYIELQVNDLKEQVEFNKIAIEYADKYNLGLVVTNDSHYLNQENFTTYDLVRALQENKNIDDPTRKLKPTCNNFYIIPPNIMEQKIIETFGEKIGKQAILNTKLIADQCNVKLSKKMLLPKFNTGNKSQISVLENLCLNKLQELGLEKDNQYIDRLNYELNVIQKANLESYFLIAWDFSKFAKEQNIRKGPGRGSGTGSLVCYALEITDINPIKHNLLFERFINPDRISMPDLDLDFEPDGREKIINYLKNKYGEDKVVSIITFNSLKARAAIRDVARTYGVSFATSDTYIKLLPHKVDTIEQALYDTQFKARYLSDQTFRLVVDKAREIEGFVRQPGRHAAGIVISPTDITDHVPLAVIKDNIVCQYDKDDLELIGLLKMDILGLRTLTVIQDTLNQLENPKQIEEEIKKLDDVKTLKMINAGNNDGVFQLEGQGISQLGKTIGIKEFNDIVKLNALYRPGAMSGDMLQKFIENRKNPTKVKYVHPLLKDILKDTHGILLFQETTMNMAKELAGFSNSEADMLRKAIAKGKTELITNLKDKFIAGCKEKNSIEEKNAIDIYSLIEAGGYAFNMCVSGNTIIRRASRNKYKNVIFTVEELYKIVNDKSYAKETHRTHLRKALKAKKNYGNSLSLCKDNRIRKNIIQNIIYQGKKETIKITLDNGSSIIVTPNHKFPLSYDNYITADKLKIGDNILICGKYEHTKTTWPLSNGKQICTGKKYGHNRGFPTGKDNPGYVDGSYAKYLENTKNLDRICQKCSKTTGKLSIHHIDKNRNNNEPCNLIVLCDSCHKKIHYELGRVKHGEKGYPTQTSKITNIENNGITDVYDIVMAEPNHTFVTGNGILTCNSHATAYSVIAFYTAYLKAHYPYEFFSSLLSSTLMDKDRKPIYLQALKRNKLKLIRPHVNISDANFSVHIESNKKSIVFGLNAIKDVVGDYIVKERNRGGPYKGLVDFILRTNSRAVTAKTIQGLTKAGALDDLGFTRKQLLYMLDEWPKFKKLFIQNSQMQSLFQDQDDLILDIPELNVGKSQLLSMERDVLSEYIGEHPLDEFRNYIEEQTIWHKDDLDLLSSDQILRFAGILKNVRKILTKKSQDMAFLTMEGIEILDQTITVFPEVYKNYMHLFIVGKPMVILGRKNSYKDESTIVAIKIAHIEENKVNITTQEENYDTN